MEHSNDWFNKIYQEQYKQLLRTANHLLPDPDIAEDVVQSVFLTLLMKKEQLQDHPNILGWLSITLKNQIGSEIQKAKYHHETLLPNELRSNTDPYALPFEEVLPAGLSDAERQLLYLHIELDIPYDELADRLGCSPNACKMRVFRAKVRCRELMMQENFSNHMLHSTGFDKYKKQGGGVDA